MVRLFGLLASLLLRQKPRLRSPSHKMSPVQHLPIRSEDNLGHEQKPKDELSRQQPFI